MRRRLARIRPFIGLLLLLLLAKPADGQSDGTIITPRGEATSLTAALAEAQDGDNIEVHGGLHHGPLLIDRSVTLVGIDWPIIDGGGEGTTVKIIAPDVTFQGFVIRNSGDSLAEENSGIAVEATGTIIEGNRLEDTLFGVYLKKAHGTIIRDNQISSMDLAVPRRGCTPPRGPHPRLVQPGCAYRRQYC